MLLLDVGDSCILPEQDGLVYCIAILNDGPSTAQDESKQNLTGLVRRCCEQSGPINATISSSVKTLLKRDKKGSFNSIN